MRDFTEQFRSFDEALPSVGHTGSHIYDLHDRNTRWYATSWYDGMVDVISRERFMKYHAGSPSVNLLWRQATEFEARRAEVLGDHGWRPTTKWYTAEAVDEPTP